ncbi:hypothetical protein BT69DRAFT_1335476 [Atractiella rhizophila]|nr:hypothetical protein BT69DRAFT_1335476 [Atractiella rhizophila]
MSSWQSLVVFLSDIASCPSTLEKILWAQTPVISATAEHPILKITAIKLDSSDDDLRESDSIRRSPRKHARELPRGVDFEMDTSFEGWKDDEIIDFDIQRWGRSKVQKTVTSRVFIFIIMNALSFVVGRI